MTKGTVLFVTMGWRMPDLRIPACATTSVCATISIRVTVPLRIIVSVRVKIPVRNRRQICLHDRHSFPFRNPTPDLRIQLVKGMTAGSLHIVMPVPAKTGNEKQKQRHIGHEDLIVPVTSASAALNCLRKRKLLPPIRDSNHEKHRNLHSAAAVHRQSIASTFYLTRLPAQTP